MSKATKLHRDPLEFVYAEADGRDLQAVALIGIDGDGSSVLTSAGATPEEMLMMSEMLRAKALDDVAQ